MCNSELLTGAAAITSASASYRDGRSAQRAGQASARMDEDEAIDAVRRGSWEEQRYRREVAQVHGAQRAAFGARNVQGSSGTALDLIGDTARIGEEDALQIRENARREALGLRSRAQESRRQGDAAYKAGKTRAGASLLAGGSQAWGIWKDKQGKT